MSLGVIKSSAMKAFGRVEREFHEFLFSMLDDRGELASRIGRFTPRKEFCWGEPQEPSGEDRNIYDREW